MIHGDSWPADQTFIEEFRICPDLLRRMLLIVRWCKYQESLLCRQGNGDESIAPALKVSSAKRGIAFIGVYIFPFDFAPGHVAGCYASENFGVFINLDQPQRLALVSEFKALGHFNVFTVVEAVVHET
jgi:hypothetical protein